MAEDIKVRSIRLPEKVWNALDEDADRCRRSSQKHLEALLVTIFGLDDVDIDASSLEIIGKIEPKSKKSKKVA